MNNQNGQSSADKPADELREQVMRDIGMTSSPMPRWQRTLLSFLLGVLVGYALLNSAEANAHGGDYSAYLRWYCVAHPDPEMCAYMKGLADE